MTRMRPLARRMGRLGTETAFEVLARARALEAQGRSIVHLESGEPDFAGGTPVSLPLREENDFVPDLDELRRLVTPKTKLIILNSPHNPTGGALSREAVREIARVARDHDIWVLSDEIYADLLYDGTHVSIAREEGLLERTIVLDGFSKTFAMTGWRLGYGAFPRPLVEPATKLVTNSVSCNATFTQRAGIVAMSQRPPEVAEMLSAFRKRRDAIVAGLNRIEGVACRTPAGAFYVFPNITGLRQGNAATVASRVLNEAGVACLAGTAFGAAGEGHLRLSYANSLENLDFAVGR